MFLNLSDSPAGLKLVVFLPGPPEDLGLQARFYN